MQLVRYCYDKVLTWSEHPHAVRYLALVSFIDASLFPISPLFMFLPMAYTKPNKAFQYALIAAVFSIFGGLIGYALGYGAYEAVIKPFISYMGYDAQYQSAMAWFEVWGYWAIFLACFSPIIPYKIFTIGAGAIKLPLLGFLLASSLGRLLRFLLLALLISWLGPKVMPLFNKYLMKA